MPSGNAAATMFAAHVVSDAVCPSAPSASGTMEIYEKRGKDSVRGYYSILEVRWAASVLRRRICFISYARLHVKTARLRAKRCRSLARSAAAMCYGSSEYACGAGSPACGLFASANTTGLRIVTRMYHGLMFRVPGVYTSWQAQFCLGAPRFSSLNPCSRAVMHHVKCMIVVLRHWPRGWKGTTFYVT